MPPRRRLGVCLDGHKFSFHSITTVLLSIISCPSRNLFWSLFNIQNHPEPSDKVKRKSILFASINWVSEEHEIIHYKSDCLHL